MPMPPPPPVAFTMTGKPISAAAATASLADDSSPVPGIMGTPTARASDLAVCFSPNASSCPGAGPTNAMPASSTCRANPAFSERKPYPGWIAPAPVSLAAARMAGTFRYEDCGGGGPMQMASSASRTCGAAMSASE